MKHLFFSLVVLCSTGALATGSLDCVVNDENIKFNFSADLGSTFGAPLLDPTTGKVEIKNQAAPIQIPLIKLNKSNVTQYWNFHNEVKMVLYWEPTGDQVGDYFSSYSMVIETEYNKMGKLVGTYSSEFLVNSPTISSLKPSGIVKKASGTIKCSDSRG